jgi:hypothetical protein
VTYLKKNIISKKKQKKNMKLEEIEVVEDE